MTIHGLPPYDAAVLVAERPIADYFESVVEEGVEPKIASNWVINDAMRGYNEAGSFDVTPASSSVMSTSY